MKFRAWDSKRKRFAYSMDRCKDYVFDFDMKKGIIVYSSEDSFMNPIDGVVEQYTGVKDRKGVEIYEGDIIKFIGTESLFEVEWRKDGFMGRHFETLDSYVGLTHWKSRIEVVGSVHTESEKVVAV